LKSVHIGSGDQLASNKIAIGAFFLLKELEREAEHSPQSNAEFKNCVCVVCVCVCVVCVCVCVCGWGVGGGVCVGWGGVCVCG